MTKKSIKRIEVKNISKKFKIDYVSNINALTLLINWLTLRREKKEILVANNISFDVYAGEIVGLIGRNGSGKSSLLRILAGIYTHYSGTVRTHGKMVYLAGMGYGLSPRLTMRENILFMGTLSGLSHKNVLNNFNDIVDFSGLKDHLDVKVYQFSTGMISRLIFSILIHCVDHQNPDILLIDEVLSAGGDADFQKKATERIERLIKGGSSVILVSHDMGVLNKYCGRVMWLESGTIKKIGNPKEIINEYIGTI